MQPSARKFRKPGLENLEGRVVPATGITLLPTGVLSIEGTQGADYALVTPVDTAGKISVTLDTADGWRSAKTFNATDIKRIEFNGKKADDAFINKSSIPSTAVMSVGNTVLKDLMEVTGKDLAQKAGRFLVDPEGVVTIDYLFRGGSYEGQLAVFSLTGMEGLKPNSLEFAIEAAKRASSNSPLGKIVIDASVSGARFSGSTPWEGNFNFRAYGGKVSARMTPGDTVGVMLIPQGKVANFLKSPSLSHSGMPLFSMPEANQPDPATGDQRVQMVDLDGNRTVYGFEDLRLTGFSDKDYNDLVFQIAGATGAAPAFSTLGNPNRDFSKTVPGGKALEAARIEEAASTQTSITGKLTNGCFTVGAEGKVEVDFLSDNGGFTSQVGIFSMQGMESLDPSSMEFRKEALRRALSNSRWGYLVISDQNEGARFQGKLEFDGDFNRGTYLGVKTFSMQPGDTFAVFILPNGLTWESFLNPNLEGAKRPLFSISQANPIDPSTGKGSIHLADMTGAGTTFGFEDSRLDGSVKSDRDFNDIIFRLGGLAKPQAESRYIPALNLAEVVNTVKDLRKSKHFHEIVS